MGALKNSTWKDCYRNMNTGLNAVWTDICRCKHQKKQKDRVLRRAYIANEDHTKVVALSHPLFLSSLAHKEDK